MMSERTTTLSQACGQPAGESPDTLNPGREVPCG